MNELESISGIGPAFAKKLVEKGIKSIADLKKNIHSIDLTNAQQIGLKYVDEFKDRIPRQEVQIFELIFRVALDRLDSNIKMDICGSYRRESETSGDIDVLITQEKSSTTSKDIYTLLPRVIKELQKDGIITDTISQGNSKFMGVCMLPNSLDLIKGAADVLHFSLNRPLTRVHRRLDILFICNDEYIFALLYYTGSGFFNNEMRIIAKEKGFSLNEHSLTRRDTGEQVKVKSEEEVFKAS